MGQSVGWNRWWCDSDNMSCGRRGLGIAMHCCSAEREDDGGSNVAPRSEKLCVAFIIQLWHISKHLSLYLGLVFFLNHLFCAPPFTSGCFPSSISFVSPFYLGLVWCTFSEKYQKLWPCVFEGVGSEWMSETPASRKWLVRRFGRHPHRPAIYPSKSDGRNYCAYSDVVSFRGTGKCCVGRCFTSAKYVGCAFPNTIYISLKADGLDYCDTPRLCRFAERGSFGDNNVLRPRSMEGARFLILRHFTSKLNSWFSLWIYLIIYRYGYCGWCCAIKY